MHSVKLKIDDKVYDHLLWFLKKFSKDELEIVVEDNETLEDRQYLETELKEIVEGNASFYSIDEVEQRLDKVIARHEDHL
jgi:hypothetical protein